MTVNGGGASDQTAATTTTATDRLDVRDDDAVERFAAEQSVTAEQVRWMIGKVGSGRSRLIHEARKLLDLD